MKNNSHYTLSISDLIMGVLFIFILILMKFMIEYHNLKRDLLKPILERTKILKELKKEIEKEDIKVEIDIKNGVLKLMGANYFNSGEYQLNKKGKGDFKKIKNIFKVLICYADLNNEKTKERWPSDKNKNGKSNLEEWKDHCKKKYFVQYALIDSILIEGHADSTPIPFDSFLKKEGIKNNLDLAMKRAQTAFKYLLNYKEAKGYDPDTGTKVTSESGNHFYALVNTQSKPLFGVASYGNLRRSDNNQKKSDRRVDFRFIMSQPEELKEEITNLKGK